MDGCVKITKIIVRGFLLIVAEKKFSEISIKFSNKTSANFVNNKFKSYSLYRF